VRVEERAGRVLAGGKAVTTSRVEFARIAICRGIILPASVVFFPLEGQGVVFFQPGAEPRIRFYDDFT
jgi:hypothetical protein